MIVPDRWAQDFGEDKVMDTSIDKIATLLQAVPQPLPINIRARWEVMQETEPGFSTDAETDIAETVRMFNQDPDGLRVNYPKHYKLLTQIIGS